MSAFSKQTISPFRTGITCKCPACGKGKLFKGFLDVEKACSVCGQDLQAIDSGDGPAVFVIFILGFLVVGLAFWTEMTFSPPYWLQLVIWMPTILFGSIGLLRPFKALLIALQFKHKATSEIKHD
ncbi:MAG: DUF983 domain-containing protein [Sneathiella sp.]|nr:DUF983 domain-containing protein [Sneathiella sp.]